MKRRRNELSCNLVEREGSLGNNKPFSTETVVSRTEDFSVKLKVKETVSVGRQIWTNKSKCKCTAGKITLSDLLPPCVRFD